MSAATVVRGTGKSAPSYLTECHPCGRCGRVRRVQSRKQEFCIDCRGYARADGWVDK